MAQSPRPIDDPTPTDSMRAVIRAALMSLSGIRVGIVKKYDPLQRTADVQPVRRRTVFGKPTSMPLVTQAPVGWWRFGQMVLAGELELGDEVLLITCEREVWPWYLLGKEHDPGSERMHDQTDTIVLPFISSLVRPIAARLPRTFFMGREDGTAGITIPMDVPARIEVDAGPLGIVLGSEAVEPALKGTAASTALNTYAATITSATSALAALANTWAGLPGANQVAYAGGHAAWLTAITGAQTALASALTASLAAKVAVE